MTSRALVQAEAYQHAQRALADLKHAVFLTLANAPPTGLKNSEIGRALGIYGGHVGHQGHMSRTVLHWMQSEGTVEQDAKSKVTHQRHHDASPHRLSQPPARRRGVDGGRAEDHG
jgi:hypothetical protein